MNDGYTWRIAHVAKEYGSPEFKDVFIYIIEEAEKKLDQNKLNEYRQSMEKELKRIKALGFKTQ